MSALQPIRYRRSLTHLSLVEDTGSARGVDATTDAASREDPRILQAGWDVQAMVECDAQFRAVNDALRGPEPERTPLALAVASAIGGAFLIAGVIISIAWFVRLYAGARGIW